MTPETRETSFNLLIIWLTERALQMEKHKKQMSINIIIIIIRFFVLKEWDWDVDISHAVLPSSIGTLSEWLTLVDRLYALGWDWETGFIESRPNVIGTYLVMQNDDDMSNI